MFFIKINNNRIEKFHLEELEIRNVYNDHKKLLLILRIEKSEESKFDLNNKLKIDILKEKNRVFSGIVNDLIIETLDEKELVVRIEALDESIYLVKNKNNRIYQDSKITFKNIIEDVLKNSNFNYHISKVFQKAVGRVLYQYEESDWDFLIRISSYINQPVIITKENVILFGYEELSEKVVLND